ASVRGNRPDFGFRRNSARPYSEQGRGIESAFRILVSAVQKHIEPFRDRRFRGVSEGAAAVSGSTRRPLDDCAKNQAAGGGMRGPRLPCRFRLERVPEIGERL